MRRIRTFDVNGRTRTMISIRVTSEIRTLDEQKARMIPSKTCFTNIMTACGLNHLSESEEYIE